MSKSKVTAAEIREALAQYIASEDPSAEPARIYQDLCRQMDLDFTDPRYPGRNWEISGAAYRFQGQVSRLLNEFAHRGLLIKRGSRRTVCFYLPEKDAELTALANKRRAEEALRRERVQQVKTRLVQIGITPLPSNFPVQLGTGSWERLLELAERGKRHE